MGVLTDIDAANLAKLETERGTILKLLHFAGPAGATETTITRALESSGMPVTRTEVRRHLDYLEECDPPMVKVLDRDRETWAAKLTPSGTNLVQGAIKAPPGIARV